MAIGRRVRQGDVVAYVGMSGLATGPHLHYEFRVNGTHRDPLTVPLPRAESIAQSQLPHFFASTAALLAELDRTTGDAVQLAEYRDLSGTNRAVP
jgi:hypothetical protein